MKSILSSATIATFFTCAYNSPVVTILAVIIALFVASIVAELLTARNAKDAELDQHYQDIKALFQEADNISNKPIYQEDLWVDAEINSCEFACPISLPVVSVKALPPCTCIDSSPEIIINYQELTYKQLQQLCRERRKSTTDIRLNAERSLLEAFLANS